MRAEDPSLDRLPVAVLELDLHGRARYCNEPWSALTGLTRSESVGTGWRGALDPSDHARLLAGFRSTSSLECGVRARSGRRWTRWLWTDQPAPSRLVTVLDLSDERLRQAELLDRAARDPLTDVLNRRAFLEHLTVELHRRTESEVGVVFADLDGFKQVNDEGGHALGDEVLRVVAHRLRVHLRSGDALGRVGGDEFAVCCTGPTQEVYAVAHRIDTALSTPIVIGDRPVWVRASTGLVLAQPGESPEAVLDRADKAMYEAKQAGARRVVTLDAAHRRAQGLDHTAVEVIAQHVYAAGMALSTVEWQPNGDRAFNPIDAATHQLDSALEEMRSLAAAIPRPLNGRARAR